MPVFLTIFFGLIALLWLMQTIRVARGMRSLPDVRQAAPLADTECPRISVCFSARDEAEKMPAALATLLSLDYPNYEVVAVNDRSTDATGRILDEFAARDARLKVIYVAQLPAGWLGKPHGLQRAYEASNGEWLVFTDADVRFAPDLLRRAAGLARQRKLDHLTLLGSVDMHSFWECVVMTFFMLGFTMYTEAWRVNQPASRQYCGVGAFQMVRRAAYEAAGTHTPLRMEVVDDMKLAKLLKLSGVASGVASAGSSVAVHWHPGLGGMVRGTTKNFFAAANFSLAFLGVQIAGLLLMQILPFAGIFYATGWGRMFAAVAYLLGAMMQGSAARRGGVSRLYGLTMPLGAAIFAFMLLNSTYHTLRQGGIVWRDTFYPLEDLRKGMV